ncbi:hypothetical protein CTI14_23310 [Methylobacterium radiotolerans]|nr:hypothetical protein CTI14_23310 [Methylobacterium radiotolerans]
MILTTTYHTDEPPGWLPYEVSKAAKNRLTYVLGEKLRGAGIACVAVSPGWMRTELMLEHHTPEELAGQTETPTTPRGPWWRWPPTRTWRATPAACWTWGTWHDCTG